MDRSQDFAPKIERIESRRNERFQSLRRLLAEPAAYRQQGRVWIEGDHLCRALLQRGFVPLQAVMADSAWARPPLRALAEAAPGVLLLPDALMQGLSGLESPSSMAFLIEVAPSADLLPGRRSVVLDRLQDPGNVGSILRSAAAFGVEQVLALKGTVSLWSPKVLRAGMGAHFGLRLVEGVTPAGLAALGVPLVAAHLRDAEPLHLATLPDPLAWVFGHEGQGVGEELVAACALRVLIPQPGGEESLNVAAAAAVCLYESMRGRGRTRP